MSRSKSKSKLPENFDLTGLCVAVQQARLSQQRPREERVAAVRQYAGRHYAEEGSQKAVPVNLLGLYVQVMSRSLVAKNPRVMLSTFIQRFKPIVSAMESWANKQVQKIQLAKTLERGVVDSFFNMGIVKVALASPADAAANNWNLKAGEAFAEIVDLDDFVFDVHCRDFSKAGFLGHRVRVPLRAVKKWLEDRSQQEYLDSLEGSEDSFFNQQGDERISMIARGYYSNKEEYEEMADLWEIYMPRERLVITLLEQQLAGPTAGGMNEPLHVQPWLGPDCGPYHLLQLGTVPGNAPPKAPIMDLIDLHEAVNRCYRKLFRTIDRLKEVTVCRDGHTEDGAHIMEVSDGDMVTVGDPSSLVQLVFSGNTLQTLLLVAPHLRDLFSWMAGNLESMAGLSPQAKTLGQDEMLKASASLTVSDMQDRTVDWTSGILGALCWYWHYDPYNVMQTEYQIKGLKGVGIQRTIKPEQRRQYPFEALDIKTDPYSMQHQTPESKMAQLNQVVTQIVLPILQLLVQQGVQLDISAYLQKLGTFLDMPDLADILTIAEPPAPPDGAEGGGGGPGPIQPAQTERKYTRTNMPGRTRQGDDQQMRAAVLGVNPGGNPNTARGPRNMIGALANPS